MGIRIVGATVSKRIDLDRATPRGGGPLCPIEFERCHFKGRFSGAHAHFSRLSFRDCTFEEAPLDAEELADATGAAPEESPPKPTIDLAGATLDADLHLAQLRPLGIVRGREMSRADGNHLWIRLIGARVDGEVDLCDCHLRAPVERQHLMSENAEDALDLSLTQIAGDLQLVGSCRVEGRIKMRAAHIRGDLWMSGAEIENPGQQALFMQGVRIDGLAMLDGRFVGRGEGHPFRRFKCIGELRLNGANIGRSLYLSDAVVRGILHAPNLTVGENCVLDGEFSGPIDLSACSIGGSLNIAGLNLGGPGNSLSLSDGTIGRSLKVANQELHYALERARSVRLVCLPGVDLVETLWSVKPLARPGEGEPVPAGRHRIQAAFLVGRRRPMRTYILHLDGHTDVLQRAARHFGLRLDRNSAVEYAKLHGAYVHTRDGRVQLIGRVRAASAEEPSGAGTNAFIFNAAGIRDDLCRRWQSGWFATRETSQSLRWPLARAFGR
ncbi:MAG TPA: hypothetical protein VEA61_11455 [Allosphingosinicella sp.]|nr:hypothetical protein [Allosphingosinicella sp.]